jgi:ribonuclease P protein component
VRQAFILQMARTPDVGEPNRLVDDDALRAQASVPGRAARVGFTASRKIGGAVARNRAKRRLRAVAVAVMPGRVLAGHDYVLVARSSVLTCVFANLAAELISALDEMTRRQAAPSRARKPGGVPSEPRSIAL